MLAPADAQLTALAVDGDRAAFAELYRRHERRVFNLCLRLLGSPHDAADATQEAFLSVFRRLPKLADRPLRFDAYVLSCGRNASYDLLERRGRQRPTEEIVATADDAARPGDGRHGPHEDPERRVLLEAQQEEIRRANACLPERQREVLALRELGDLSYDEIAEIMGLKRNAVAQLISRARINLRAALRRTALDTVAASGPDCERALALIAARADGEDGFEGDDWLAAHLDGCESCPVAREAMAEAGMSYRAWAPLAAAPWLFRETMAKAAEIAGEDWSEILDQAAPGDGRAEDAGPGSPSSEPPTGAGAGTRRRRAAGAAAALVALVLVGVLAPALGDATRPAGLIVPQIEAAAPAPAASQGTSARSGKRRAKTRATGGAAAPPALAGVAPSSRAAARAGGLPAAAAGGDDGGDDPLDVSGDGTTIVSGDPPPPPPPPPPNEPPPPPPPGDTDDPGSVRPPPPQPPPPPPPRLPPVLTGTPPPPPCSTAVCPPRP